MLIEEALRSHLVTDAGLAALVGDRVYPIKTPQRPTLPAVVYFRVSGVRTYEQQGPAALCSARFQFDVVARTYAEARGVGEQLRLAMDRGPFPRVLGGAGGVTVYGAFMEGDGDGYEDELEAYVYSADYAIDHAEAQPA